MPNRTVRILSLLALLLAASFTAAQEPMVFRDAEQEQRFQNLTLELRCAVCQNQNLADSDAPLAQDLRQEINAIAAEILQEKAIVLNRDDRMQLNSELYDEVTGLGPLAI